MIIALDGPAASGKGTLSKRIAAHYKLHSLDTGLLYRAVALALLNRRLRLDDVWAAVAMARALDPARLDDPDLRRADVGEGASVVAKIQKCGRPCWITNAGSPVRVRARCWMVATLQRSSAPMLM